MHNGNPNTVVARSAVLEYELWKYSTSQDYGTTLCFSVKEKKLYELVNKAKEMNLCAEIITDPTYPDNKYVYPMNTCGFIFLPKEHELLKGLKLHK